MTRVHVQGWQEAYRGIMPDQFLDTIDPAPRLAMWTECIAAPDSICFAALDGVALVGVALAAPARRSAGLGADGEVVAIYVLRSHSGLGLGRLLMGRCAMQWSAQGGASLAVRVLDANLPARRFYERLGGIPGPPAGEFRIGDLALPEVSYLYRDLSKLSAGASE
jgi:GNAT superfamily N-acetyltransferase